jgi:hypothetical protein
MLIFILRNTENFREKTKETMTTSDCENETSSWS